MTTQSAAERGGRQNTGAVSGPIMVAVSVMGVLLLVGLTAWAYMAARNGHGILAGLQTARSSEAVSVADVALTPDAYYGQTIELAATAGELLGGRMLVVTDRVQPHDHELALEVAADRVLPAGVEEGDWIVVRGTVRRLDPTARDLASTAAEPPLKRWIGRPVIVEASVAPVAS